MSRLPAARAVHPKLYRLANAGLPKLWKARLSPPADLDEDRLFAQARRAAKLDDFGIDDGWHTSLRVLIAALKSEAGLNPVGYTIAHGSLLKVLIDRLRAEAMFAAYPEIRARPLVPPIVICGAMRSGTTRLQRLLACDDRLHHTRLYETLNPVPWQRSFGAKTDPRIAYAARGVKFLNWANPGIAYAHPTGALEAEEETGLLEHSFWGAQIEAQRRVPGFARHCENADALPAYRRFADLLRMAGWFRGNDPALPWLLKSPQYLQDLPALTTVMPGARLIFVDRAAADLVASGCSLVWNQMVVQSDAVDPAWIGQEWLHKTALRQERAHAFQKTYPAELQLNLNFEDMNRDWRAEIEKVYAWLGLPLSGTLLAKMDVYLKRAEAEHGFAKHHYRLEDFGLTQDMVEARVRITTSATTLDAAAAAIGHP